MDFAKVVQYPDINHSAPSIQREISRVLQDRDRPEHANIMLREMFITLQAEMPFAGYPAIFVRVGGCNRGVKVGMGCDGCDTSFSLKDSIILSAREFALQIHVMLVKTKVRLVVITGGEPMLQAKSLAQMLNELESLREEAGISDPITIQFETNGDFAPPGDLVSKERRTFDMVVVVSPKGSTTINLPYKEKWFIQSDTINYPQGYNLYLRHLICADNMSTYYDPILPKMWVERANPDKLRNVFVSPVTDYEEMIPTVENKKSVKPNDTNSMKNFVYGMDYAIKYGVNFSYQWHVHTNVR